jgi:hypothetical protein
VKSILPGEGKKNTALLVEPDYKNKYPSLGLLKYSTYLKNIGYSVDYYKGINELYKNYDEILITTLFTKDWAITVDTINYYKSEYPDSDIFVGGIYASLLPNHIYKHTGIKPIVGCNRDVDEARPDYNLIPIENYYLTSRIFTTRGCPRKCDFCGVRLFEPESRIIRNWKKHLLINSKLTIIHDNNILFHGDDHFEEVLGFIKEKKLQYLFDNGLDCRLFLKNHAKLIRNTRITELRFSFDSMEQDGYIQDAIRSCILAGFKPWKIKVFVLYNYQDSLDDALYRFGEIEKLGAKTYAMRYQPLIWLNPNRLYKSKNWDYFDIIDFHSYVNKYSIKKKYSFSKWKQIQEANRKHKKDNSCRRNSIFRCIKDGKSRAGDNNDNDSLFNNEMFLYNFFNED